MRGGAVLRAGGVRGGAGDPAGGDAADGLDEDCDLLIDEDLLLGGDLMVTELMGSGVNPVTGDYSRGASGFIISKQGCIGKQT